VAAAAATAAAAAATGVAACDDSAAGGWQLHYRQSVFFMYEKRLRSFSPPEKVRLSPSAKRPTTFCNFRVGNVFRVRLIGLSLADAAVCM